MPAKPAAPEEDIRDGRRRKGQRRRRVLLEATMRLIERGGAAAVSQRAVAVEAGLPPSAVTYYFPTVDKLLVAALAACNDRYLSQLAEFADDPRPLERLARVIAASAGENRGHVAAEYELFLMAARRPDMRAEMERWTRALDGFLAPKVPDPVRRAGVAAAVDGLFLRYFSSAEKPSIAEVLGVLERLVQSDPPENPARV